MGIDGIVIRGSVICVMNASKSTDTSISNMIEAYGSEFLEVSFEPTKPHLEDPFIDVTRCFISVSCDEYYEKLFFVNL